MKEQDHRTSHRLDLMCCWFAGLNVLQDTASLVFTKQYGYRFRCVARGCKSLPPANGCLLFMG